MILLISVHIDVITVAKENICFFNEVKEQNHTDGGLL